MKRNLLVRMNILVCLIIVAGFIVTIYVGYHINYNSSLRDIEQVTTLTSEGIYYQLAATFTKPVNISLTMAHDQLLISYLNQEHAHVDDGEYAQTISDYLAAYREKYRYDSVFLVSCATGRYYNFDGVDRVLTQDNAENEWYFDFLKGDSDTWLNVDNDEVAGAENRITVFVNCKIPGHDGQVLGVVGVGLRIESLQALLAGYVQKAGVDAFLIDQQGTIQISTDYTGYEKVDLFEQMQYQDIRTQTLDWHESEEALTLWTRAEGGDRYVVTRYIPELSWHLVAQRDTGALLSQFYRQIWLSGIVICAIILVVLAITTCVIRSLTRQIVSLTDERREIFRHATEQMYDNIYEINITQNRAEDERTERYFESLGVPRNTPYDEGLKVIARKQIKEEYRQGYLAAFAPANVLKELSNGNHHLRYDFMISEDGGEYFWMRIDAYVESWPEDNSVHMFVYRKNIDQEMRREMKLTRRALTDGMTGLLSREAIQEQIDQAILSHPQQLYAYFIFDIDNFKQANDLNGHAFGDQVIMAFTGVLRRNLRKEDLLGRIGGDEFVAFIPVTGEEWARAKAQALCQALDQTYTAGTVSWHLSASIGVSIYPRDGSDRQTLYRCADAALYQSKERGKNCITVYGA